MGSFKVGYPGLSELPTTSPVLCPVPSYVSLLHDVIESLRASHVGSSNQNASVAQSFDQKVQGSCRSPSATRSLGMPTEIMQTRPRTNSLVAQPSEFTKKEHTQRPRSASPEPNRARHTKSGVCQGQIHSDRGDTAAAQKGTPHQTDSVKAILKERLELLKLASTGSGAASYGLSTTVKTLVIRTKCEETFRSGRLLITLAELVDTVIDEGFLSLPDAIALVREEWWGGGLRLYDGAERLLQPHFISAASTQVELTEIVKALHTAQASPKCAHLTWPLLHTILQCFQREQLRPTLDLILETCSNALGLKCCVWDVVVAASMSLAETCVIEVAPWPVPYLDDLEMEQNLLAWVVLTLNTKDTSSDGASAHSGKVFPQYSKCLQKVVENEFDFKELHHIFQSCLQQAHAHAEPFKLPVLLARATSQSPRFDGPVAVGASVPCGALLWIVEKNARAPKYGKDGRRASFGRDGLALERTAAKRQAAPAKYASGSSTDIFSSATDLRAASGSLDSFGYVTVAETTAASGSLDSLGGGIVAETVSQTGDDIENDCDEEFDTDEEDEEEDNSDLAMTPMEAFISCFYEDLMQHNPLYLSSVNNLFRMRSGDRKINYQKLGCSRMAEFLAEIPGVQLIGTGNQMEVSVCNANELTAYAQKVMKGLNDRIQQARQEGLDTSQLQLNFVQPKAVPPRILEQIWKFFQEVKDHEVSVSSFLPVFKQMYPNEKLHFRALGYPDIRGLMAQVRFIEKVGGRRQAKYVLKKGAVPPKRTNVRFTSTEGQANRVHVSPTAASSSSPTTQGSPQLELRPASQRDGQNLLPKQKRPGEHKQTQQLPLGNGDCSR